jgi:hypothetical protein
MWYLSVEVFSMASRTVWVPEAEGPRCRYRLS